MNETKELGSETEKKSAPLHPSAWSLPRELQQQTSKRNEVAERQQMQQQEQM